MDGKKSPTIKPMVSRAPTPISPVGGSSWRLPERIKLPRTFLSDYPVTLSLRTWAVINEAREKFPRRPQLLDFCKQVLANLTPTFCTEVKAARLYGPRALSHLDGLLDSLLLYNEYSEPILADLGQELKRSKERAIFIHELSKAEQQARVAETEQTQAELAVQPVTTKKKQDRRRRRDPQVAKRDKLIVTLRDVTYVSLTGMNRDKKIADTLAEQQDMFPPRHWGIQSFKDAPRHKPQELHQMISKARV